MNSFLLFSPSTFNTIDWIIILGLLWGAFRGFRKGLILEVVALIGIFISLFFAFRFSYFTENILREILEYDESTLRIIAFIVSFLLLFIGLKIIGILLTRLFDFLALGLLNKLLGSLFGVLKIIILFSGIALLLSSTSLKENVLGPENIETSRFYTPLDKLGHTIFPLLQENINLDQLNLPDEEP